MAENVRSKIYFNSSDRKVQYEQKKILQYDDVKYNGDKVLRINEKAT